MRGIDKRFGRVEVLSQIDLDVRAGEIVALLGENGAGKSTLIKVLTGLYARDAGEIRVDGEPAEISTPADAEALGIRVIHQDRHLAPRLTVAEQFFLGSSSAPRFTGRGMYAEAERRLRELVGLEVSPRTLVDDLTVAEQQQLQIAQAISERPRVLVLDEPTAPLAAEQVERLFATIERLRADGVAMIYISHYLQEVQRIADRVVVLRNGSKVGELSLQDRRTGSLDDVVGWMVGHQVDEYASARQGAASAASDAPALLQIEELRVADRIESFSLQLRPGEVVGVTGLVGSGVEELAGAISGLSSRGGTVHLDGKRVASPRQFVAAGGAHVPADRRRDGVLVTHTVDENLSFAGLGRVTGPTGLISRGRERALGRRIIERLGIRPARGSATVSTLSGGNQQKVAVGKWLAAEARVFVLDQPTAGVDIGSREQIYQEISTLVEAGAAVLLISLDLEELLGLSDRILVLYRGRITAELPNEELGAEQVLAFSSGAATVNEEYQI
jgi:ribose transport system ATP-binding protein